MPKSAHRRTNSKIDVRCKL